MNRVGHENVDFFTGTEVERTPAFGRRTLFVVGVQPIADIAANIQAAISAMGIKNINTHC
jgi:hypothetical protein